MIRFDKFLLVFSLVSIALGADKDHDTLAIGPASSYTYKQTSEGVTIAADVYETGDKVKEAFGKHNPYDYGVLPILVVIENHSSKAIRAERLDVEYTMPGHGRVEATPAGELKYIHGVRQPRANPAPIPGLPGVGKSKQSPLAEWQIEGRAFSAKMIPPGDSASGFFYFQTGHRSGSTLYLSGLTDAASGHELLYFVFPLAPVQ